MPRILKKHQHSSEAAWYASPAGRRQTERDYQRALKDGTLIRSEKVDVKVLGQLKQLPKGRANPRSFLLWRG